jgi:hypothetical protein
MNVGHLKVNTASIDVADIIIFTCVNMKQQDAHKWTKPKTGITPLHTDQLPKSL